VSRKHHRKYLATLGWGRGSDPGSAGRNALPERTAGRNALPERTEQRTRNGNTYDVVLPARPARDGRPRTKGHDLCPRCLKLDRESIAAHKAARAAQIAARDAARDLRDQQMREGRKP
jgi:hypothetical protein